MAACRLRRVPNRLGARWLPRALDVSSLFNADGKNKIEMRVSKSVSRLAFRRILLRDESTRLPFEHPPPFAIPSPPPRPLISRRGDERARLWVTPRVRSAVLLRATPCATLLRVFRQRPGVCVCVCACQVCVRARCVCVRQVGVCQVCVCEYAFRCVCARARCVSGVCQVCVQW